MSFFSRQSLIGSLVNTARFVRKLTRSTGRSRNTHRSNRAKKGLFHGKDVRFGHSISHSHQRSKRRWYPNVINKRVWSYALDDWVRFKMTTTALKAIDYVGGVDNYILSLDEASVKDSNYITKVRAQIANALHSKGLLPEKLVRRMGGVKAYPWGNFIQSKQT